MTSAMMMWKMSLRTMITLAMMTMHCNVVMDDGLRDSETSEDEGLGEGKAVEDKDDLGDDDAEDVTEDNDNLGNVDVADH